MVEQNSEPKRPGKRAVVIIHGIGNQAPMATLRGFVDSVWTSDDGLGDDGSKRSSWPKPQTLSESFELRRITTSRDKLGKRTDFFEFYWAHMMEDTQYSTVLWWFKRIFARSPSRVPCNLIAPWLGGIAALVMIAGIALFETYMALKSLQTLPESLCWAALWLFFAGFAWLILWYLRHRVIVEAVGDAASYMTAAPQNIAARDRIRAAGIQLLESLHGNNEYDRVIVVCHSLGTVIGYDLLSFFWSNHCKSFVYDEAGSNSVLSDVEAAAKQLRATLQGQEVDKARLAGFQTSQRNFAKILFEDKAYKWKITDFITLGSPLAHAHLLLVDDGSKLSGSETERAVSSRIHHWYQRLRVGTRKVAEVLAARIAELSLPACPPVGEDGKGFLYKREDLPGKAKSPNHAAVFGAVRWTNIYAPRRWLLWGDVIGGPVAPLFGPGVKDVALSGAMAESLIAHVNYWDLEKFGDDKKHIEALRAAVNLLDIQTEMPTAIPLDVSSQ